MKSKTNCSSLIIYSHKTIGKDFIMIIGSVKGENGYQVSYRTSTESIDNKEFDFVLYAILFGLHLIKDLIEYRSSLESEKTAIIIKHTFSFNFLDCNRIKSWT